MTTPEEEYARRGNDYLRDQLELLRKDKRLRNKLTLLRVECRRCDSALLEVIATRPWWVVVKHGPEDARPVPEGMYERPEGMSVKEFAAVVHARREAQGGGSNVRPGPSSFVPLHRSEQDDDWANRTRLVAVCRCHQFDRRMTWLYSELERAPMNGHTHVVPVSPPDFARGAL